MSRRASEAAVDTKRHLTQEKCVLLLGAPTVQTAGSPQVPLIHRLTAWSMGGAWATGGVLPLQSTAWGPWLWGGQD